MEADIHGHCPLDGAGRALGAGQVLGMYDVYFAAGPGRTEYQGRKQLEGQRRRFI